MSPPSQKLPQDPLEERETGIGAIACEERPELCPVGDETCPDKTIETILNEKKICRPESSCENHPELCVPKCASNLVLNPLTLKCEPITPPPLKCVPPEVFDAQSNLCGVVNPPQPPPPNA